MTTDLAGDTGAIRAARARNPKMRERDFARLHGLSEGALVAAHVGFGVRRLRCDVEAILSGLEEVGEVMALTRNESAVHEKIGSYGGVKLGGEAGLVIGEEIDLRVFPRRWRHAFAVEKTEDSGTRRSLQFFDAAGEAVHKVHLRDASRIEVHEALVDRVLSDVQSTDFVAAAAPPATGGTPATAAELDTAWRAMTDTHQFHSMLKRLNLARLDAIEMAPADLAWPLGRDGTARLLHSAAASGLPIMAFVGNAGCIQIHSGPIKNVAPMGPWLNVMDESFHLHLRLDRIAALWAVRKPTGDGHVTSVEAYDAERSLIIQFFGERQEGVDERPGWRALVEELTRATRPDAA